MLGTPTQGFTLIETETNPAPVLRVTVWWERQTCVQTVNIWDDQNCDGWGVGWGLFRPVSRQGLREARHESLSVHLYLGRRLCSYPTVVSSFTWKQEVISRETQARAPRQGKACLGGVAHPQPPSSGA